MISVITFAAVTIAAAGILIVAGVKRLGIRILAAGAILAAAGPVLMPHSAPERVEQSHVFDR